MGERRGGLELERSLTAAGPGERWGESCYHALFLYFGGGWGALGVLISLNCHGELHR